MSIAIMTQVWGVNLTPSLKLVLLALADNADDDGLCWPSIDTIAAKSGRDRRETFRALAKLEEIGQISHEQRPGHSNLYHIHPQEVTVITPVVIRPRVGITPPTGVIDPTVGVCFTPPTRDTDPTQNHHESSIEPSKNQSKRKKLDVDPPELPDWLPTLQWEGWIEARTRARKPPTNLAKRMAITKLEGFREKGHNVAQILMKSAMNNWADVFEPKE